MSLDEEYENQQSWRTASDKLTFIVCAPLPAGQESVCAKSEDRDENMRGDINFFLYPYESDSEEGSKGWYVGEVDVMIASLADRGRGVGKAAVCALLVYIKKHLKGILEEFAPGEEVVLRELMVKIKEGNVGSRRLFMGLGFVQRGEVNYFGEVMLVMPWEEVLGRDWWEGAERDFKVIRYE